MIQILFMTKINIGTKVLCVNDEFIDLDTNPFKKDNIVLPKEGIVYTVRDIYTNRLGTGIRVSEIINNSYFYGAKIGFYEPTFGINRFIPEKRNSN